jgi:hypothetical protein
MCCSRIRVPLLVRMTYTGPTHVAQPIRPVGQAGQGYPTCVLPQKRPGGGGPIADSTARAQDLSTQIRQPAHVAARPSMILVQEDRVIRRGKRLRRSTCASFATNVRGLLTTFPTRGVTRNFRNLLDIGREPEPLFLRLRGAPFRRLTQLGAANQAEYMGLHAFL